VARTVLPTYPLGTPANAGSVNAADKSSMSGKTKKARDYGIQVISVAEFLDLI
jgi:hypothetical protein